MSLKITQEDIKKVEQLCSEFDAKYQPIRRFTADYMQRRYEDHIQEHPDTKLTFIGYTKRYLKNFLAWHERKFLGKKRPYTIYKRKSVEMSEDKILSDYEKAVDLYKRFTSRYSQYHFPSISKLHTEYQKWRKSRPYIKPCFMSYMRGRLKNVMMWEEYRRINRQEVKER